MTDNPVWWVIVIGGVGVWLAGSIGYAFRKKD